MTINILCILNKIQYSTSRTVNISTLNGEQVDINVRAGFHKYLTSAVEFQYHKIY